MKRLNIVSTVKYLQLPEKNHEIHVSNESSLPKANQRFQAVGETMTPHCVGRLAAFLRWTRRMARTGKLFATEDEPSEAGNRH